MADKLSKEKRSELMSRVRSRGNKSTELRLIAIMREHGVTGWRRKQKVFGHPDFVFCRERVAVFVDGCFWHGCPKCYTRPTSNQEYWDRKFKDNQKRDRKVSRELRKRKWTVVRIWEHQLREPRRVAGRLNRALGQGGEATTLRRTPQCGRARGSVA